MVNNTIGTMMNMILRGTNSIFAYNCKTAGYSTKYPTRAIMVCGEGI